MTDFVHEVAVPRDDPLFAGHYPGFPLLPGAFVVELVHRAVCARRGDPDVAGQPCTVVRAQFHRPVRPGDQLRIEATTVDADGDYSVSATVHTAVGAVAEMKLRYPA